MPVSEGKKDDMKQGVIAGLVMILVVSWTGLTMFETSLWMAFAVMAFLEAAAAVAFFVSRWRNRPAAIVLALLAVFQVGQSYAYEKARYTSSDPVIPIDNFGVFALCVIAAVLIADGPPWPGLGSAPRRTSTEGARKRGTGDV